VLGLQDGVVEALVAVTSGGGDDEAACCCAAESVELVFDLEQLM
jgi:hypothetical protein